MRASVDDIVTDIVQIEEDICYIQRALQDPDISDFDSKVLSENMEILQSIRKADIKELKDEYCFEYGS